MSEPNVTRDALGGEYRVFEGEEQAAFWLPLSKDEAQAVVKKSLEVNVYFPKMLAEAVRSWLSGGELTLDQLEGVVGGVAMAPSVQAASLQASQAYTQSLQPQQIGSIQQFTNLNQLMKGAGGTVMCGW